MKYTLILLFLLFPAVIWAQSESESEQNEPVRAQIGLSHERSVHSFSSLHGDGGLTGISPWSGLTAADEIAVSELRIPDSPLLVKVPPLQGILTLSDRWIKGVLILGNALLQGNRQHEYRHPATMNVHQFEREVQLRRFELNPVSPNYLRW